MGKAKLPPNVQRTSPQKKSLEAMLYDHPDLKAKLIEAIETNRFFITISWEKKDKADDPHNLRHFYKQQFYPAAQVIGTLRHLIADATAKLMPGAAIDEKTGGMY